MRQMKTASKTIQTELEIMNYKKLTLPLVVAAFFGSITCLRADDTIWPEQDRIGLNYRMGFNISTKFRNLGAAPAANNPSFNGRSYQDGFVGTDDTGNAGDLTTFWGYQNASQVQDGNAVLLMRSANSGTINREVDDSPYHGLELTYNHEFARNDTWRWGIEAAFNWTDFSARQTAIAPTSVLTVDAFPLGYEPPQAPYTGPFSAGPFTPLLGTTPTQLPVTVASSLDAALYGFRLGPYLDVPLSKCLLLTLSAGLAVTIVDGEYSYAESSRTPGGTLLSSAGRASATDAVFGGFVGLQASLKLGKHVNAFTGLQYQGSDSYKIRAGDKEAEIDFSGAMFWTVGLSFSF